MFGKRSTCVWAALVAVCGCLAGRSYGDLFVASTSNECILRFDEQTGEPLGPFVVSATAGVYTFRHVFPLADGRILAVSDYQGVVATFDAASGRFDSFVTAGALPLFSYPGGAVVTSDGRLIVAGTNTSTPYPYQYGLWSFDLTTGALLVYREVESHTYALTQAPDGRLLRADLAQVHVHDPVTLEQVGTLVDDGGRLVYPRSALITPQRTILVSDDIQHLVHEYDLETGEYLATPVPSGLGGLTDPAGMVLHPTGDLLVASNATDEVLQYTREGAFVRALVPVGAGGLDAPGSLLISPEGALLVTSQGAGLVLQYDIDMGEFLGVYAPLPEWTYGEWSSAVYAPDGTLAVTSGAWVYSFDPATQELTPRVEVASATGIAFTESGTLIACAEHDLAEYDWKTGERLRTFGSGSGAYFMSAYIDGDQLLVPELVSSLVLAYDVASGAQIGPAITPHNGGMIYPSALLVGPAGTLLVGSDDYDRGAVYEFDVVGGAFLGKLIDDRCLSMATSLAGTLLVGHYGRVDEYEPFSGEFLRTNVSTAGDVDTVVPMLDGSLLVGRSSGIDSYDAASGVMLRRVVPADGSPLLDTSYGLAFDAAGHLYVAGQDEPSAARTILKFHGVSGEYLGEFVDSGSGLAEGPRTISTRARDALLFVGRNHSDGPPTELLTFDECRGEPVGAFNAPGSLGYGEIFDVHWLHDGALLALVGDYGLTNNQQLLELDGYDGSLTRVILEHSDLLVRPDHIIESQSGTLLVAGSLSDNVLELDPSGRGVLRELIPAQEGLNEPLKLARRPDGVLLVLTADYAVRTFDEETGVSLGELVPPVIGGQLCNNNEEMILTNDGLLLLGRHCDVQAFDAYTGAERGALAPGASPQAMVLSPSGTLIVASAADEFSGPLVAEYDTQGGELLRAVYDDTVYFSDYDIAAVAVREDGILLLAADDEVYLVDLDAGAITGTLVPRIDPAGMGTITDATIVDADTLMIGDHQNRVLAFDAYTGSFLRDLYDDGTAGLGFADAMVAGPDDATVLVASSYGRVLEYDRTTGAFQRTVAVLDDPSLTYAGPKDIAFAPDGSLLVSTYYNGIQRFDYATGASLGAFVPSGSGWLASAVDMVFRSAAAPGSGDVNGDTVRDLADFTSWPSCDTGPQGAVRVGCEELDIDGDLDVDLSDAAYFANLIGSADLCTAGGLEPSDPPEPSSNCCDTDHGPGCDLPEVESCVCFYAPLCCSDTWDGYCTYMYSLLCGGGCE